MDYVVLRFIVARKGGRSMLYGKTADAAAHVCLFCLLVMVKVFDPFWGHGGPSLVNFCHHGNRLIFKNGGLVYLDVNWVAFKGLMA